MLRILQAGGFLGSYAGDCAALVAPGHVAMIDWGAVGNMDVPYDVITRFISNELVPLERPAKHVIITHMHQDHCGGSTGAALRHARKAKTDGYQLWHFGHSPALPATRFKDAIVPAFTTSTQVSGNVQQVCSTSDRNGKYELYAIPPKVTDLGRINNENIWSGGAYARVLGADGSRHFSFLTLGDMDPGTSQDGIKEALSRFNDDEDDETWEKVDLLKYPHHGSANNWSDSLEAILTQSQSHVLMSGYTKTEFKGVENAIGSNASSISVIVFSEKDVRELCTISKFVKLWKDYREFRVFKHVKVEVDPRAKTATLSGFEWECLESGATPRVRLKSERTSIDLLQKAPMED